MKTLVKASITLAAVAIAALGFAQQRPVLTPQLEGVPVRVQPTKIMKVRFFANGKWVPLGPWVYLTNSKGSGIERVGNLLFDAYEGNGSTPDAPTDGLYGETFIPEQMGARWTLSGSGGPWINTFFARRIDKLTGGIPAMGIDLLVKNNALGDNITAIGVFTSDDPFDPNAPVPPSTFNDGVVISYTGIPPNAFAFSNVDVTGIGGLPMPSGTTGWYHVIYASNYDPVTQIFTQAASAQPGMWGTKVLNPSQASIYEFQDGPGDGTLRDGDFDTLYDWTFSDRSTAASYTVTRGVEQGTHDPTKLNGVPGSSVVVQQRFQPVLTFNNAEVTATVTIGDATTPIANFRLLRGVVRAKANALPLNNAVMTTSMFNRTTNAWVVKDTRQPTNAAGDGEFFKIPSIPRADIPSYIDPVTRQVQLRIGVRQPGPTFPGWNLTVNLLGVDVSTVGPDPLVPAWAFSAP